MIAQKRHPIDVHAGARLRERRMICGMSQVELANGVGLTFQQVQKYEKGANRMGASRLAQFADILSVPVSFFFDKAPHPFPDKQGQARGSEAPAALNEFQVKVALAVEPIKDPQDQRRFLAIARIYAEDEL